MHGGKPPTLIITVSAALQSVLVGLWPLLLIYTVTLGDYTPEQLIEPAALIAAVNLSLWALLFYFYKEAGRAAFIVTILSLANFLYLPLSDSLVELAKLASLSLPSELVLALYFLSVAALLLAAHQRRFRFGNRTLALDFQEAVMPATAILFLLCAINLLSIGSFESRENAIVGKLLKQEFAADKHLQIDAAARKPDVYYVIVDGFANQSTLKDMLGYDDQAFLDFLRSKGFYIASSSCSNHDRTIFSVTSSLNMRCMTPLRDVLGEDSVDSYVPLRLLRENRVMKMFKQAGYRIVNVCSGFCPTDYIPQADLNMRSGWGTGFNMSLLHLCWLGALEPYFHLVENEYANVRLAPSRRAAEIANLPGPKLVLIHCLLTHPPFIFDSLGGRLPLTRQLLAAPYVKGPYIEQLKFTEKRVEELVGAICSRDAQAIIIVQSDHGSACTDWHNEKQFTLERLRILNAYRLPESMQRHLTQTITPVNSFRLILRELFKADLPPLEDESFIAIPPAQQYKFRNVTGLLQSSWRNLIK